MATSGNVLSLPFRKSIHLSFKSAVKQYISEKYDQHPDMFRDDLEHIDLLRRNAVNVHEAHPSGILKLQAYASQLVWMGAKFPIDIGCDFSWYPALGYNTDRPVIRNNLKFELINVLFNMAALYVQLAVSSNRASSDGLKTAANHFMHAAGVLSHIKTNIVPNLRTDAPDDMDSHSLDCLTNLFLAQAQECFWHRAVNDGLKDATISKLAVQVSDLYADAGNEAVNSQAISSPWIHHMSAKHHHFAAAAQYRAARDCLEKRRYGEEVARLKDAVACVKAGLNERKGGYVNQAVLDDLEGLEEKAKQDLKRAEKDNDIIYLHPVPPKPELKIIDRAKMAFARCPQEVSNPTGPALFSKLVPFAVHVAVSQYEENKNTYVEQKIIRELEAMEEQLREEIANLNLPASLQAFEKPLGLPPSVIEYADVIQQERALEAIPLTFSQIDEMRRSCCEVFIATHSTLEAEEEEDEALRKRYGTDRWARPGSREDISGAKHWDNCTSLENYLNITSQSDASVRNNFDDNYQILKLLSGHRQGLLDFVPSSRRVGVPPALATVLSLLRGAYNDVLRLQSRRRKKVEGVQARARQDDIRADILQEASRLEQTRHPDSTITPADFDSFFDRRITTQYGADLESLAIERDNQARLLEEVSQKNRQFEAQKRLLGGDDGLGGQERQNALQELERGYNTYCRIKKDTESGKKFYNELMKQVDQLSSKAIPWVELRRREARDLEADLTMPHLTNLSISNPASPNQGMNQYFPNTQPPPPPQPQPQQHQPQHQHQPQQQQQQHRMQSQVPVAAAAPPPLPPMSPPQEPQVQSWASQTVVPQQPRPMQAATTSSRWTPDMGIKFGAPGPNSSNNIAAAPSLSPGKKKPVPGTWDQTKPLRFG